MYDPFTRPCACAELPLTLHPLNVLTVALPHTRRAHSRRTVSPITAVDRPGVPPIPLVQYRATLIDGYRRCGGGARTRFLYTTATVYSDTSVPVNTVPVFCRRRGGDRVWGRWADVAAVGGAGAAAYPSGDDALFRFLSLFHSRVLCLSRRRRRRSTAIIRRLSCVPRRSAFAIGRSAPSGLSRVRSRSSLRRIPRGHSRVHLAPGILPTRPRAISPKPHVSYSVLPATTPTNRTARRSCFAFRFTVRGVFVPRPCTSR